MADDKSVVPVPDPTLLTTAALRIAIESLEKLLQVQIEAGDKLLDEKIRANTELDEKRHDETRKWLSTLESRRLEAKIDAEKSIDRALESQKELFDQQRRCNEEAVSKSELTFTKQLEALSKEAALSRDGLHDRINSLKERIDKGEGGLGEKKDMRLQTNWMIGLLILGGITFAGVVVDVVALLLRH